MKKFVHVFLLGLRRSLFMRFWRTRSVHVLLVENKYICSCVSVGEWSLFMCLWWEMNRFVHGFLVGNEEVFFNVFLMENGEVCSYVSGRK